MGTLKIGTSSIKKIYRGSKEVKRVHSGLAMFYPEPFLLTRTRNTGSDIGVIRNSSYNPEATIGVLPSINEAPDGLEIYMGDKLTILATASQGYTNPTVSVNGSEGARRINIEVTGDISVVSTSELEWTTVYEGSLGFYKDINGHTYNKTLTVEGLLPDVPTRISGTFTYEERNAIAELSGEVTFENEELTRYFRCDGTISDDPYNEADTAWKAGYTKITAPTTADTLEYTYKHERYAWVNLYITKIEQQY